jgi:hypothetical protein
MIQAKLGDTHAAINRGGITVLKVEWSWIGGVGNQLHQLLLGGVRRGGVGNSSVDTSEDACPR